MQAMRNEPQNHNVDPQRDIHGFVLQHRTGKGVRPSEVYIDIDINRDRDR